MKPTETYTITLRTLPSRVPAISRLKAFLKRAKRDWNFQCTNITTKSNETPTT